MADVEVNLKVKADTNALTAIKKELKEMKALALNGDGAAAKRVAELTDKLEDLKDTTKSLKGDGVERLQNSFSLLNESLRTGDMEKFKTSLKGVGSAMSAIPLLLIIEGLKALFDNFDKVIDAAKVFFSAFNEGEKRIKSLNRELERQKEINKTLIAGMENEIKILEAQGASSAKILEVKKKINAAKIRELEIDAQLQLVRIQEIIDNDSLTESYYRKSAAVLSSLGQEEKAAQILKLIDIEKRDRAKDALDKFKADSIAIANLKTEDKVNTINFEREKSKAAQKANEEAKMSYEDRMKYIAEQNAKAAQEEQDLRNKSREDEIDSMTSYLEKSNKIKEEKKKEEAENDKKLDDEKKLRKERELQIEQNYVKAAADLSSLFFDFQLKAAEGNEAKQLEIKKRAFQVEKAFRAAQAIIDTTAAVQKTYAAGGVLATPLAISMGVLGAVNVAKILAQQFNPGSAPSASQGTPRINLSGGSGQNPAQQTIPTNPQQSSQFDENGKKINERPIVVKVSEINGVQRNVARVEEQSRF